MKKEQKQFKRVIKKRKKRANKGPAPKFKWMTAPKPVVAEKESLKEKVKNLLFKSPHAK